MKPGPHEREQERLAVLRSYGVLDTPRETDFDDVVKILADICDAPFSTITLIDADRQWHKAAVGIGDLRETSRDVAFCAHTILQDEDVLIVPDATKDPRFADNPFVTGEPRLRFYAGAVLRSEEGLPLGTVCVVDYKPRELDARQRNVLHLMARQVMAQIALRREVAVRRAAEEQQKLLIAELHHRVKNTLATVQAVIQMSLRSAADLAAFRDSIVARIGSLANTHTLLSERRWGSVSFRELVAGELAPYQSRGGIVIDGPDFQLPAQIAVAFGMVLHELTTNAGKYGALSHEQGKLAVSWAFAPEDLPEKANDRRLTLRWTESGGPPVTPPTRDGFGSTLLRRILAGQLRGKVDFDFRPQGLDLRAEAGLPGDGEI
jgi:two-component sensor histidine kinase